MKMISLSKNQFKANGRYGKYFRISLTKGVKILGRGSLSKKNLKEGDQLIFAAKEATFLKIAEKSKLSPKIYDLTIAKYQGKYYPAIVMEHIAGVPAINYDSGKFKVNGFGKISVRGSHAHQYAKKALSKSKIIHADLHYNNMIVTKNKSVRAIDFSPEWVRFVGDKSYYMMLKNVLLEKVRNEK